MAFMGYETPVEMPSMGVYNTDLMKMYIAGVKDQYEKGREEMKDFMKLYGDFYSDVPGATEAYNLMTIGGARDMINQMLANGIDPYKSPEARAAISRYIASVPTGILNEMKRSAENAKEYKKNLAKAMQDPNFDPEFNKWMIGGDLDTWDPRKPWTVTAPYIAPSMKDVATPYMEKFKLSEMLDSDRPGYIKLGTTDANQLAAIRGVLDNWEQTPWGKYNRYKADQQAARMVDSNGAPLTNEQKKAASDLIMRQQVEDFARLFFQPKYEEDWRAKMDAEAAKQIRVHAANRNYDIQHPIKSNSSTLAEHPSYGHTMYYQGVGKLFGLDVVRASLYISDEKNLIGKNIAAREDALMKKRRTKGAAHAYDFKGVISDHTSHGDAQSNIELLGLSGAKPRSASVQVSAKNSSSSTPKLVTVGTLRNDQIQLDGEIKSRMVSDYALVQSNAGYAASKHSGERYGFATNKKNAKYATVTDKVVTLLSKNGRVEQYVKVILHDDHNNVIDSAYILAQRSMLTAGGQSYTMRNMYGSEQNVLLDVVSDYGGRHVNDAKATQRYMNKSKKDSDVYESGDDSEDEYEDE